jgi:DNA-binding XRE family transcriptional regulator
MEAGPLARLRGFGLTQVDLARLLSVGQSTISQWETGARQLPIPVLEDLWELLKIIEERTAAGMMIEQAVENWHPTVTFGPGGIGRTTGPMSSGSREMEAAVQDAAARGNGVRLQELLLQDNMNQLAAERGKPLTAERVMRIRRLAIAVQMDAYSVLRVRD